MYAVRDVSSDCGRGAMMAKHSDIFTDGPKGQRVIKTLYGDVHEHSPEAKEIARQMKLEKERRTKRLVFKNARTEARARAARLCAQARAETKTNRTGVP